MLAAAAPDTPVVIVTGQPGGPMVYAAMAEGADEYVCTSDLDSHVLRDVIARATQRRHGASRHRQALASAASVFDSISAPIAVIDGSGRIVTVNEAWSRFAADSGADPTKVGIGVNYLAVCDRAEGRFAEDATTIADGIRAVLAGDADSYTCDYPCHSPTQERWYSLRVTPCGEMGGGAVDHPPRRHRPEGGGARRPGAREPLRRRARCDLADLRPPRRRRLRPARLAADRGAARAAGRRSHRGRRLPAGRAERPCRGHGCLRPGRRRPGSERAHDRPSPRRRRSVARPGHLGRQPARRPHVGAIAVTGSDVTDPRLHQIARRLESRLLTRLPVAIGLTDDSGIVVYWNERAEDVPHLERGRRGAQRLRPRARAALDDGAHQAIQRTVARDHAWEGDVVGRRADGTAVPSTSSSSASTTTRSTSTASSTPRSTTPSGVGSSPTSSSRRATTR